MVNVFNLILGKKNYLILAFTLAYLSAFTVNAIVNANFEFLYYTFFISFFIYIVIVLHQNLHLAFFILLNMSVLGFLHLLGGNFYINELRLYDFYFLPGTLKYDNFIHAYASFIGTLALYSLLVNYVSKPIIERYYVLALILVLMAMGVGTLVELAELGAVLFFGATEQVGDYYNNSFDLIFNTLGAVLATLVIYLYRNPPKFIQKINGTKKLDSVN